MRRHHTPLPDDARNTGASPSAADDHTRDDITQEFWGATRGWVSDEQPATEPTGRLRRTSGVPTDASTAGRDDTTGAMRAIRDGLSAFRPQTVDRRGDVDRTRSHGIVRPSAVPPDADDTPSTDDWDDWLIDTAPNTRLDRVGGRDATIGELGSGAPSWSPAPETGADEAPLPTDDTTTTMLRPEPTADRARRPRRHQSDPRRDDPTGSVPVVGLNSVDPQVVRFGLAALVLALLVPLALSLRPTDDTPNLDSVSIEGVAETDTSDTSDSSDSSDSSDVSEAAGAPVTASPEVAADPAASATTPSTEAAADNPGDDAPAARSEGSTAPTADPTPESQSVAGSTSAPSEAASDESSSDASSSTEAPQARDFSEQIAPSCAQQYTAGPGDSWYRIAGESGMGVDALLSENGATLDSTIFPGDEICLTAEADVPATPTTAPATTDAPDAPSTSSGTTAPPATAAPTTTAPATTAPPTTSAPAASSSPASPDEVKALIREIWPEDQHEMALTVARRESNYNARAWNGHCCYGVFQLYYSVHAGWLDDYGINSASDLYDARKNITAAYALYQQSGGWGPWRQTAY